LATDIQLVISNLNSCFDFSDKTVIHVGAGGGQFIGYASRARHVLGVDPDPEAVARLQAAIAAKGLTERFTTMTADFSVVSEKADVVFFEFCLHEIENPQASLRHACSLAQKVLIIDHQRDSRWSWYCGEDEKVERGWTAAEKYATTLDRSFVARHVFHDYSELQAKVASQGEPALSRIKEFLAAKDFAIEMAYRIAVLALQKRG
jgi:hypothetical protein